MKSKTIRVIFLGIILFFENCTSWPGLFLFLAGGGGGGGNSPLLILPPGGGDSSGSNTTTDGTGSGNTPSLPTLQFASSTSNGSEATASHQVVVSLSGSASETVTVDYTVSGGTATGGGVDYTLANGTLSFASGETSKNIDILLVDDGLPELNETIEITLSNVSSKASLGSTSTHTFTIVDDDSPNVSFASSSSNGNESSTPVTIPVNISISSAQVVTVDYTVSGTATGGGVD